jgi:C1A family cysteine protease
MIIHSFGYVPDTYSAKDWIFAERWPESTPKSNIGDVDLRPFSGPIQNQRQTGSCVAHAVVKAMEIVDAKRGLPPTQYSTLHNYYLARSMMFPPQTTVDRGTHIRTACDAARKFGVCEESEFPFREADVFERPKWNAMRDASNRKVLDFYRIAATGDQRLREVLQALRSGFPVIYGTSVDQTWHDYHRLPRGERRALSPCKPGQGRHATTLVGWVDGLFVGENSWGSAWGYDGYYYAHESVIVDKNAKDFWVLRTE